MSGLPKEFGSIEQIVNAVIAFLVTYSLQIIFSLIFLFIGWKVANWIARRLEKLAIKKNIDITLAKFMASGLRLAILVVLIVVTLGNFGITITPLIAAIGAAAFGVTVALKGPLANLGAGLAIILTRPYSIGNTVTIRGYTGVVEDIKLFSTVLTSHDGERITIPNNKVVGEILVNTRQFELVTNKLAVDYGENIEHVTETLRDVLRQFPQVPQDPPPEIGVLEFGDLGFIFAMRFRAPSRQVYDTRFQVNQAVIRALREKGIRFSPAFKPGVLAMEGGATP